MTPNGERHSRAADGSPVELYRHLQPMGEPELLRSNLPPGASLLELGCGVGRITHPLLRMGYSVVAVDNSPEMLAHVDCPEKVLADIETLDLGRKFDAVLLMSHLVNVPEDAYRASLLRTCRRHLSPDGIALIQRHDPDWLRTVKAGPLGDTSGVPAHLDHVDRSGNDVEMTLRWATDGKSWTQFFTTRILEDEDIEKALEDAGLTLDRWIDPRRVWLSARAAASNDP